MLRAGETIRQQEENRTSNNELESIGIEPKIKNRDDNSNNNELNDQRVFDILKLSMYRITRLHIADKVRRIAKSISNI